MAFVHEIQIQSAGFPGAPGYTNLYFELATVIQDTDPQFVAAKAFLDAISPYFPNTWSGQIVAAGRILEETSGLLATFSAADAAQTAPVAGTGGAAFGSGVSGAVLGWSTATVNRARLVRGRTFLVPVHSASYDANGTLVAGLLTGLTAAGDALIASASGFGVYSRPRLQLGGKLGPAISCRVNDRAAFLSSRRS